MSNPTAGDPASDEPSDAQIALEDRRRQRQNGLLIGVFALILLAGTLALASMWVSREKAGTASAATPAATATPDATAGGGAGAIDGHESGGTAERGLNEPKIDPFRVVDADLPEVPSGPVKKFRMDVYEHTTKVAADKPETKVWSYGVNGKEFRGTGQSAPIVVNEGDRVEITLTNGLDKAHSVDFPHSVDFHSAEVVPEEDYSTIGPGRTKKITFTAKHPGVFMYHCATDPVLMHTGSGMVGMMVVKPRDLPEVDRELWINQQEFYLSEKPGMPADLTKMQDVKPDVVAFNGFANQYKQHPIKVKQGERIRLYVLNAGPSIWSAFHVIGSVFDKTLVEGEKGEHAQTINLAPSQGGYVELTLDKKGAYPFVNHSFGAMVKGAGGVLLAE